jgi:hypothetical protein
VISKEHRKEKVFKLEFITIRNICVSKNAIKDGGDEFMYNIVDIL